MTAPPIKSSVAREVDSPCFGSFFEKAPGGVWGFCRFAITYIIQTPPLWIPLVLLGIATLIFRWTDADLFFARLFFGDLGSASPWPSGDGRSWLWFYNYGIYPAWILGCGGLAIWLAAFFWKKIQPIRDEGLFLALLLALGPGVLVNGISKPYCGRPRPHLTKPFGGKMDFLPVLTIGENLEGDCNSFPSGHAAMGFYLMAPAFVLYRRRPGWAAAFLLLGVIAGCTIGLARMAAGAHFASDIVWAAAFVYFTGLLLAAIFRFGTRG